jgi:BirA family biotin operon repressor/biotin-[acetyl-CoA-carboxylase] ligase
VQNDVSGLAETLRAHADNVVIMDEVDSTHDLALRLIDQLEDEGLTVATSLVLALRQSGGRGRRQRRWSSPDGGVYVNWIRAGIAPTSVPLLPMIAAAATVDALVELGLSRVGIKWPNDLLVDGHKLGGLLVHVRTGSPTWATVGLGVNVLTTPVDTAPAPQPPTSLHEHLPGTSRADATRVIVNGLAGGLDSGLEEPSGALDRWRSHLVHAVGDPITVHVGTGTVITGTFNGLTAEGHLSLDCDGEPQVISSGDIIE